MPVPTPHVLLLRGINVGGNHTLPMRDLVAIVSAAGARNARTYIQSGNVVCDAQPNDIVALRKRVGDLVVARFGFSSPVVARSAAEWTSMIDALPFAEADGAIHLACLADLPAPECVAQLDPNRSPGDRFVVHGCDVYLSLKNGVGGTRITNAWLDATLMTVSTARNWRTVMALAEMLVRPVPTPPPR